MLAFGLAFGLTTSAFSIAWGSLYRGLPYPGADRLVRVQTTDASGAPEVGVRLRDYLAWRGQGDSLEGMAAWVAVGTRITGDGDYPEHYDAAYVTDGFFRLVGVDPRFGRSLRIPGDIHGVDPGAVISHRLWTVQLHRDPHVLGREIEVWNQPFPIVGVMPEGFRFPLNHDVWVSLGALLQEVPAVGRFLLRTRAAPSELTPLLRREVASIDPELAVIDVGSIADAIAHKTSRWRLLSAALTLFGGSAVALAAIGLYGVLALLLLTHLRALGIRSALGARRGHIARALLGPVLAPAAVGLALGLALSLAVARLLGSLLVGVPSWDPPSFSLATAVIGAAVLVACWSPLHRALRLDPAKVLRRD